MSNQLHTRDKYLQQVTLLADAGVGVILTRTKEPHQTAEALKLWAFAGRSWGFKTWDNITGWTPYTKEGEGIVAGTPDKCFDLFTALKKVGDVDSCGISPWGTGVYVVHYPHWLLPKHAGLIQLLKNYSRELTRSSEKIVLLAPEGFTLPGELQGDVLTLDYDLPRTNDLRGVYDGVIADSLKTGQTCQFTEPEINELLVSGTGMTEFEFETSLAKAVLTHKAQWPNVPSSKVNAVLLEAKTEIVKQSEILELMEPELLENMGGLDLIKQWLQERAQLLTETARRYGCRRPKGYVAIGPPGTGKSLVAKVTGSLLGRPVIRLDMSKVFGKYVGESEGRMTGALNMLKAMAPCVAFIDEVDRGASGSSTGTTGDGNDVGKRVTGQLLTFTQECREDIFWVFTANRSQGIDPALIRKGRMDEVFSLLPPNRTERSQIIDIHLRKCNYVKALPNKEAALAASEGYVSSEVEAAVVEAVNQAFLQGLELDGNLIALQLNGMTPLCEAFPEDFTAMREWARRNARPASIDESVAPAAGANFRPRRRRIG